jgi:hypothetical protein
MGLLEASGSSYVQLFSRITLLMYTDEPFLASSAGVDRVVGFGIG